MQQAKWKYASLAVNSCLYYSRLLAGAKYCHLQHFLPECLQCNNTVPDALPGRVMPAFPHVQWCSEHWTSQTPNQQLSKCSCLRLFLSLFLHQYMFRVVCLCLCTQDFTTISQNCHNFSYLGTNNNRRACKLLIQLWFVSSIQWF